ncbi:hypothetical protein [Pseudoxanthomonas sp. CF125]|uniref:alpha/beta fold hydrolase n=1 Tax=Pseudoxanthomonas sp. CF125 TaxID=1855303 RepID=UPI00088CE4A4|nr:hypothetical protein [Pseudoxanthomonas sp. CF125]SDQ84073.1 Alpha/beta hydrolase family protein [Pseudoxanthomonas sp. CF125]
MSRLVIYLIHGTWPFGPFGREKADSPPAWFRPNSDFSSDITQGVEDNCDVRCFEWSGRNNFGARSLAAISLAVRLRNDFDDDDPECRYVLIAHSHGGTVAANAIAMLSEDASCERKGPEDSIIPKIHCLICMGTPFAFWTIAGITQQKVFLSSTTTLFVALLAVAALQLFPGFSQEWPLLFIAGFMALGFVLFIVRLLLGVIKRSTPDDYPQSKEFPPHIPIFAIRAPQDEASMVIGFSQALQSITREYFKLAEPALFATSSTYLIAAAIVAGIPLLVLGQILGQFAVRGPDNPSLVYGMGFILSGAIAALLYLSCHCLMALSVGYWKIRLWRRRAIEVDATPPGIWTSVKVLDLNPLNEGLRHSLHKLPEVREEIRRGLHNYLRPAGP